MLAVVELAVFAGIEFGELQVGGDLGVRYQAARAADHGVERLAMPVQRANRFKLGLSAQPAGPLREFVRVIHFDRPGDEAREP
jgi:hypothetical protein